MDVLIAVSASLPLGLVLGVLFHKYVISEAQGIKEHVSDEIAEVRADLAEGLKKAAEKI